MKHRSSVITQFTSVYGDDVRKIYVEPHIRAIFVLFPPPSSISSRYTPSSVFASYQPKPSIASQTADIHIGPNFNWEVLEGNDIGFQIGKWESWGVWRKNGKESVEWLSEWEVEHSNGFKRRGQ
jgi:hypothetical protein